MHVVAWAPRPNNELQVSKVSFPGDPRQEKTLFQRALMVLTAVPPLGVEKCCQASLTNGKPGVAAWCLSSLILDPKAALLFGVLVWSAFSAWELCRGNQATSCNIRD